MRMAIFTAGYADSGTNLYLMQESAVRCGHKVITYGGLSFKSWLDCKVKDALPFVRSVQDEYDLLMWVDGFDSLVLGSPYMIWSYWEWYKGGDAIIVATERNCWPDADLAAQYPDPRRGYINAGGYIGPPKEIIKCLETLLEYSVNDNDQLSWHRAYVAGALPNVVLDHGKHIFACMSDGEPEVPPCVLHFNGKVPGREEYWKTMKEAGR